MKRSLLAYAPLVLCLSSPVWADLYTFERISSNSSSDVASQLLVNVTNPGGGKVDFKFTNAVGLASSITQIYFDDDAGVLGAIDSLIESAGVDFVVDGAPPDLPGGATISFAATHRATAGSPVSHNGINSNTESLVIRFSLVSTQTFADVINALDSNLLRIGLHVQALPDGKSDSYINGGELPPPITAVPSPTAAVLGLLGLATVGLRRSPRLSQA
jgi:hypothetical protein